MDVIDFIVMVLKDHEKALDDVVNKLKGFTEKVAPDGLSYGQARKAVMAHSNAIWSSVDNKDSRQVALEDFVQALRSANMIPDSWVDSLIEGGIKIQEVKSGVSRNPIIKGS